MAGCASTGNDRKGLRSRGGCIMVGGGRRIAGIGPARLRLPTQEKTRRSIKGFPSNMGDSDIRCRAEKRRAIPKVKNMNSLD